MRGDTGGTAAPHNIYDQHTPPPSHICTTKKDTITQTKHYIEKSQQNFKKIIINLYIYISCPFQGSFIVILNFRISANGQSGILWQRMLSVHNSIDKIYDNFY